MVKKIFIVMTMLVMLQLVSCKDPVGIDKNLKITQETSFETFYKGSNGFRFEEQFSVVLRTKAEVNALLFNSNFEFIQNDKSGLVNKLNQIDFSKDMLICMSRGIKTSSSVTFEITKIVNNQGKYLVESQEIYPETGDASLGYPIHIVIVKKNDDVVEFDEVKIIKETENDSQLLHFTTIFNKSHGIVSENKIFTVIKSKADETEFLSKVKSNLFDQYGNEQLVTIGDIDYDKDMVIVTHYGWSPSGSNYILIPTIELKNGEITVNTKYFIPYVGTDDIGYPVHIVKLEKRNEPVNFTDTEVIQLSEAKNYPDSSIWEWYGYSIREMEALISPDYKNNNKYTLNFDGTYRGNGRLNCNNYGFLFTMYDEYITIKEMTITEAYCNDDMELEYVDALRSAYKYNFSEDNLTIITNHPKYSVLYFRKK